MDTFENGIIKVKINSGMQTSDQLCAKIAQLDVLIDSLYTTAIRLAGVADQQEYEIDDGQSKMKIKYSDPDAVGKSIQRYEKLRQMLQNKLSNPGFRLMDAKNFIGNHHG